MTRRSTELVREGRYAAKVEVELIEDEETWSPLLSLADAEKPRRGAPSSARR